MLKLIDNVWEGSAANWDIEVVGPRITVRSKAGVIPLRLRLDPPGIIVIERLDMRIADCHLLVSENAYAAGRYLGDGSIAWVHAQLSIAPTTDAAVAIEFAAPNELLDRDKATKSHGQRLVSNDGNIVMSSGAGCMYVPMGISIASFCEGFHLFGYALGIRPLDGVRRMVMREPQIPYALSGDW